MPLLEWNETKYSVDIDAVDRLHKRLIELLNELHEALLGTESDLLPEEAVKVVISHTTDLFKEEEKLMKEIEYPRYDTHVADHASFYETLTNMEEGLRQGRFLLRTKVLLELKTWLERHIVEADKDYSNFFYEDDRLRLRNPNF